MHTFVSYDIVKDSSVILTILNIKLLNSNLFYKKSLEYSTSNQNGLH